MWTDFCALSDADKLAYADEQFKFWMQVAGLVRQKIHGITTEEKTAVQSALAGLTPPDDPPAA